MKGTLAAVESHPSSPFGCTRVGGPIAILHFNCAMKCEEAALKTCVDVSFSECVYANVSMTPFSDYD